MALTTSTSLDELAAETGGDKLGSLRALFFETGATRDVFSVFSRLLPCVGVALSCAVSYSKIALQCIAWHCIASYHVGLHPLVLH